MTRFMLLLVLACGMANTARAHFVFIVPAANGEKAQVVLSEDLRPDAEVDLLIGGETQFVVRDASDEETDVSLRKVADDCCEIALGGKGLRVVHGSCNLGVMQRGDAPPFLLVYHPKTIVGDAFDQRASLREQTPAEIVPLGKPGAVVFQLLARGKPVRGAEVNVVLPGGERTKVTTNEDGKTTEFSPQGRYAAWSRYVEECKGERRGKPYDEVRHYATLVIDARVSEE